MIATVLVYKGLMHSALESAPKNGVFDTTITRAIPFLYERALNVTAYQI